MSLAVQEGGRPNPINLERTLPSFESFGIITRESRLKVIGNQVRERRTALRLTQKEAGLGRAATVCQIETGKIKPSSKMLGVLSQTLGVSQEWFLNGFELFGIDSEIGVVSLDKKKKNNVGTLIRERRRQKFLTLRDVAGQTQAAALSQVERGLISPSPKLAELIAEALGLDKDLIRRGGKNEGETGSAQGKSQESVGISRDRIRKVRKKSMLERVKEITLRQESLRQKAIEPERIPHPVIKPARIVDEVIVFEAPKPPVNFSDIRRLSLICEAAMIRMDRNREIQERMGWEEDGMEIVLLRKQDPKNRQQVLKIKDPDTKISTDLNLSDAIRKYGIERLMACIIASEPM